MKINIFWFRRDLRLEDNHGLFRALSAGLPVLPVFIFDKNILDILEDHDDARVTFIHASLAKLNTQLQQFGSGIQCFHGYPKEVFEQLTLKHKVETIYTNHDYEPSAVARDIEVHEFLTAKKISFRTFKDQVIFEKKEVLSPKEKTYTVFTPYSRKWRAKLLTSSLQEYDSSSLRKHFLQFPPEEILPLKEFGFIKSDIPVPDYNTSASVLSAYNTTRDFPAADGTSGISVHLRFGTVSIRKMVKLALAHSDTWLNELIWREFFMMILYNFPKVVDHAFKPQYEAIPWRKNEAEFDAWKNGMTGYSFVDAGMRELNATGYMHNRARMITASFLTKHLLIDWRLGEAYFARKLLDYELASNNGNWQWAAGTGCDAAPYFRIFNPTTQLKKFDPNLEYTKKWIPELGTMTYPAPIVDHKFARERCLNTYKEALNHHKNA